MTNSILNSPVSVRHIANNNYEPTGSDVLELEEALIVEGILESLLEEEEE